MSYKLEDGKILVKCNNDRCKDGIISRREINLATHALIRRCPQCKDGYQEYKEPEKPKPITSNEIAHIAKQQDYQTQLSHYNKVKRLVPWKKPNVADYAKSLQGKKAWEKHSDQYQQAQTLLEELYKEHQS